MLMQRKHSHGLRTSQYNDKTFVFVSTSKFLCSLLPLIAITKIIVQFRKQILELLRRSCALGSNNRVV